MIKTKIFIILLCILCAWFMYITARETVKHFTSFKFEKTDIEILEFYQVYNHSHGSKGSSNYNSATIGLKYKYNYNGSEYISDNMQSSGEGTYEYKSKVYKMAGISLVELEKRFPGSESPTGKIRIKILGDDSNYRTTYVEKKNYAYVNPDNPSESFVIEQVSWLQIVMVWFFNFCFALLCYYLFGRIKHLN